MSEKATINKYNPLNAIAKLECPLCGAQYRELNPVHQVENKGTPYSQCPECLEVHVMEINSSGSDTIVIVKPIHKSDEQSKE